MNIIIIRMDALFPVLFWGNAVAVLFLFLYRYKDTFSKDRHMLTYLLSARMCHALYYFVASGRGVLPDLLSVNAGVSLLLVGFYFEAQAIFRIIKENSPRSDRLMIGLLAASVAAFNLFEFLFPYGGIRITTASLGNVVLMALPCVRIFSSRDSTVFTRIVAGFYCVFLLLLLGRAWEGLHHQDVGVLTTTTLDSLTFLFLLLHLMLALPAYALILKGYADDALSLMASADKLTDATNRHAFMDAASAVYMNCLRHKSSLSVLFVDIDHFRRVNARYGRAFGDTVLEQIAARIDKCLGKDDLGCRYGGEEFVVLLPHSYHSTARLVARHIMDEIRALRFPDSPDFSLTASVGIFSGVPSPGKDFDATIRSADSAMHHAKKAGRDRIVLLE